MMLLRLKNKWKLNNTFRLSLINESIDDNIMIIFSIYLLTTNLDFILSFFLILRNDNYYKNIKKYQFKTAC